MPGWMAEALGRRYRGVGTMLHIEVEDVLALHQRVVARGVEISMGPVDQSFGRRQMFVYDPSGYNLVFQQAI